jgi:hypothetical protein
MKDWRNIRETLAFSGAVHAYSASAQALRDGIDRAFARRCPWRA